jgi:hypothetical protein
MSNPNNIQYLIHKDIDKKKWDNCINNSSNSLIYARSFYLDSIAENWDAIILNDYEVVMPLTWKKKYGIHYLYQPYFTASLGIFGNNLNASINQQFLEAIPKIFFYWNIDLHENNLLNEASLNKKIHPTKRVNIFLPLHENYDKLSSSYSRLAGRKLKTAEEQHLSLKTETDPQLIVQHYINNYQKGKGAVPQRGYKYLLNLLTKLPKENYRAYTAVFPDNEIAAFYLVYIDEQFVYSIIGGSTTKGKEIGAFHFITDAAIKEFAGSNKTFRFEGSDEPGIAFFDLQFGSHKVEYWHLRMNNLPWPLNLLKK